jgi:hypothetical protein
MERDSIWHRHGVRAHPDRHTGVSCHCVRGYLRVWAAFHVTSQHTQKTTPFITNQYQKLPLQHATTNKSQNSAHFTSYHIHAVTTRDKVTFIISLLCHRRRHTKTRQLAAQFGIAAGRKTHPNEKTNDVLTQHRKKNALCKKKKKRKEKKENNIRLKMLKKL